MRVDTINAAGVVGAGTMGLGIAIASARGGVRTLLVDESEARVQLAVSEAESFFERSLDKGKLTLEQRNAAMDNLVAASFPDLAGCDIVIEAVFEDMATKADLIGQLDEVCRADAVFASNTSTLPITGIAANSIRPERVVGLHFCLPAQLMKLVEATRGLRTSDEAFSTAWHYCLGIGQKPIETKDTPGFILNHFVIPFHNRAIRMVEAGIAPAEKIDQAVKIAFGHSMGPLELLDLVGLDTQERLCTAFFEATNDPELACPNLVRQMVAAGWLGKKSGRGFYHYENTKTFGT